MKWIKNNVRDGEKILLIRILTSMFYQTKYGIDPDKILELRYSYKEVDTPKKLVEFYRKHNLSYLMFPYSPAYIKLDVNSRILEHLKSNPDKEFIEVIKYNIDKNYIYIYKLKDA